MNILVIPAYEPDEQLPKLLKKIKEKDPAMEILVVDDGSGDTFQAFFDQASHYATILRHESNQGKGQALKTAFAYIKDLGVSASIITADSDGQHSPWDIFRMAKQSQKEKDHFILGVRSFTGQVPLRSLIGNHLTALIFKLQTGHYIKDTQTGLRAFSSAYLDFFLDIPGQAYEYEMTALLAASQSMPIDQVDIETIYINHNAASHFHPLRDSARIYKELLKFAASSLTSFLIDYLVYSLSLLLFSFMGTAGRVLLANGLARITSSIFNFSSNKRLVFQNQDSLKKTGPAYFALALSLFFLDTGLIYLLHSYLLVNLLLAKVVVGLLLFLVSWYVQRKWIFKERTPALL